MWGLNQYLWFFVFFKQNLISVSMINSKLKCLILSYLATSAAVSAGNVWFTSTSKKTVVFWFKILKIIITVIINGLCSCLRVRIPAHLHADNIFNIEVLQRSDVRVFTFVRLQNQLLNYPVQQHPVLKCGGALLICRQTMRQVREKLLLAMDHSVSCRRAGSQTVLHGIMRQCCSADRRWGKASVWFSFFLISSNIWLALLVSIWTWDNAAEDIYYLLYDTVHIWFIFSNDMWHAEDVLEQVDLIIKDWKTQLLKLAPITCRLYCC